MTGIDHVLLIGGDLDGVAAQYARLGFALSPPGLHSAAKGTANHTIMLQHDYIELLGILRDTELNRQRRAVLERSGPGLHAIACRVADAEAAARDLAHLGIATESLSHFDRPVPLDGGGVGRAAFSTLNFRTEDVPVGLLFMCQHKTPDTVWLPALMRHANSAIGITAVKAVSDDPQPDAARLARLLGVAAVTRADGGAMIDTGRNSASIWMQRREQLERQYPAAWIDATPGGGYAVLQIGVARMDLALSCLTAAEVASYPTVQGHAVAPDQAGGVILEFVAS
ncbi:VOC family protein [Puniceibacterium confluentis]|uniref:VOC family protein n=1 Tax=Puniceibacterium confluentis TaxID=1958944 RepID=UPI001645D318|nr:VOC family protein [Puniceibacterium confluentis]